jgi:hypothetical protein
VRRYVPGASAIRNCPVAEDSTRATTVPLGSRRIVIDAWYGRSQTLPGRSTGQVGPIITLPVIPEAGVLECPLLPLANRKIDAAARAAAKLHLVARTLQIMHPSPRIGQGGFDP